VQSLATHALERHAERLAEAESSIERFGSCPPETPHLSGEETSMPSVSPLPAIVSLPVVAARAPARTSSLLWISAVSVFFALCAVVPRWWLSRDVERPLPVVVRAAATLPVSAVQTTNSDVPVVIADEHAEPPEVPNPATPKTLKHRPAHKQKQACAPPFYVDHRGIKRLKARCVR
jgi:hypothetical protein